MRLAIVSDIHANLEALAVVMDDIRARGLENDIVCLGDVIGYGPDPNACLDIAIDSFRWCLMGNHEEAVLYGAVGFNPKAKMAIDWTRDQLNDASQPAEMRNRRWKFLGELRLTAEEQGLEFAHGSPRDPVREYVFPTDVLDHDKLESIFQHVGRVCFVGHTHLPGVIAASGRFTPPRGDGFSIKLPPPDGEKLLINVGSVGQPRDGDYRACYVVVEDDTVTWHRLDYDVERTVEKIRAVDRLPGYLASRLREGR
ncbi:MAG: phosphoesterase [Planctomycetota bacterium]|nr:MAG: phosphoesterase [Planctomycetota bacterium]